ncbi:MAG: hypothetical protein ACC631_02440 [Halocynthiibacter sp.]
MPHWIDKLSDAQSRHAMGRRFERLTDEVFHVVRWATLVGFVRFLENEFPSPGFTLAGWVLSLFLFGYLASRFLLRPEIRLFAASAPRSLRLIQHMLNFLLCVVVFALVIWAIYTLTDTITQYRVLT